MDPQAEFGADPCMSDETLARRTGKGWRAWVTLLDAWGWEDGRTRVALWFADKGAAKSTLAVQHERLANAEEAAELRALWRERLPELKRVLER